MPKSAVSLRWDGDKVKKMAEKAAGLSSFEIGLIVQGQAKELAPVDSGRLRASIMTSSGVGESTKPTGKGAVGTDIIRKPSDKFETFVGTAVEYAPYMEYGTIRTDAQAFLRPALDMIKGRQLTVIEQVTKKGKVRAAFGEYLTTKQVFSQTNEAFTE